MVVNEGLRFGGARKAEAWQKLGIRLGRLAHSG